MVGMPPCVPQGVLWWVCLPVYPGVYNSGVYASLCTQECIPVVYASLCTLKSVYSGVCLPWYLRERNEAHRGLLPPMVG